MLTAYLLEEADTKRSSYGVFLHLQEDVILFKIFLVILIMVYNDSMACRKQNEVKS